MPKKDPRRSIYIAGKMRGLPLYGFPAFDAAAERLTAEGWIVHSPADHDRSLGFDPGGPMCDAETLAAMHRWDMQTITESDAIYMLPGWEDSDGATRELDVARVCGLEVHLAPGASVPQGWAEALVTTHEDVEQRRALYGVNGTHWDGAHWVEPPDGEAMEPRPTWTVTQEAPAVSRHAFNRAVDASVARTQAISGQRGETYQDTWSEANLRTSFLDATLRSIAEQQGHHGADIELAALTPAERRLIVVASLCDVKLSRLIGEWKQDHVDDLENYAGAWNTWMGEYLGEGEDTA